MSVAGLSTIEARRLALACAGLLNPAWLGLPERAQGRGVRARRAAHRIVEHFGYLQLDTVAVAGARSHAIVLLSRLEGFDPELAEQLLQPGEPVFEYWAHEACWLPMELYPAFEFRRRKFYHHPWFGDVFTEHAELTERLRRQLREGGPMRSVDLEGRGVQEHWGYKPAKKVATALWSCGEVAIRERRNFQRTFDLAERVIPEAVRERPLELAESLELLLLKALAGHGWATTGTLAATWRLRNLRGEIQAALERLVARGEVLACSAEAVDGRRISGWVRPADLELAGRLRRVRPRRDRGVLLSPFDPVLWDRARVAALFGFDQVLEIFKPAAQRVYGYYCLPILAGDRLVARVDLKADRRAGTVRLLSLRYEAGLDADLQARAAVAGALERFTAAVGLLLVQ